MSIQTEINRLNTAKTNILKSIKNKGVDTSSVSTLSDVSTLIDNISTGITPTGSLDITENGIYDVTNYASANVNVASSGGSGKLFTGGMILWEDVTEDDGSNVANGMLLGTIEIGKTYEFGLWDGNTMTENVLFSGTATEIELIPDVFTTEVLTDLGGIVDYSVVFALQGLTNPPPVLMVGVYNNTANSLNTSLAFIREV